MLTDPPTAPVQTYDPLRHPTEAAALRASFEHEENDTETEHSIVTSPATPPPEDFDDRSEQCSEQSSFPPSPAHSVTRTPRRRHAQGQTSAVKIHFAPNIAVHMDSGIVQNQYQYDAN